MTNNQILGLFSFVDDMYISEAYPQNKRADVFTARRVVAVAASACVLATALMAGILIPSLSGNLPPNATLPEEKPMEYGFTFSGSDGNQCFFNPAVCAYKSETNIFDIDNVTITYYYGYIIPDYLTIEKMHEQGLSVPVFDVYFQGQYATENGELIYPYKYSEKFMVRRSYQNFISEQYRVTEIWDEEHMYIRELIYTHSEVLTMPKELFKEDYGRVSLNIEGYKASGSTTIGTGVWFGYEKYNTKIVLYNTGDWFTKHKF